MVLNYLVLPIVYCSIALGPVLGVIYVLDIHSGIVMEITYCELIKLLGEGFVLGTI